MKSSIILGVVCLLTLAACNQEATDNGQFLQRQIDSLQQKLDDSYRPGLGEFMSGIQMHHAKLWFAGTNKNWKLADFEIGEIEETVGDIKKYCTDRPEVKSIPMIDPAIDSLKNAIKQQDLPSFNRSYTLLTNTCNNCHHATSHEFNVIVIPTAPPVTNQNFKPAL